MTLPWPPFLYRTADWFVPEVESGLEATSALLALALTGPSPRATEAHQRSGANSAATVHRAWTRPVFLSQATEQAERSC